MPTKKGSFRKLNMAILIQTNGEQKEVSPKNLQDFYNLIDCRLIQIYKTPEKVFVFDENGLLNGSAINEKATDLLYLESEGIRNVQDLVGNVVVFTKKEYKEYQDNYDC